MADAPIMDLPAIYEMMDAGQGDLLTEDERALAPEGMPNHTVFGTNLAETLDSGVLANLATEVSDGYDSDDDSRSAWRNREKQGIRLLGISEKSDGEPAFDGASQAVFPGLIEAIIQFQARAIAELWPAQGPAKALVEGQAMDPAREQQAQRVADYLNWLYTTRMPAGYQHHDRLLFRLPLSGSSFKKVYFCPISQCIVSRFIPAEEIVLPYGATDLEASPRITHVLSLSGSDITRMIQAGAYREVEIGALCESDVKTDLQSELDAVSSTKPSLTSIEASERYTLLEQSIITDIPGEPKNSPYLVTIERDSQQVLAVYRDWRESDPQRKRRERFVHYYFLPSLDGFYGLGLLHVVGRLAEALSGNLRALLDAATLANLRGGFRSADVRLPGNNRNDGISVKPGEWLPVEATAEELQKLFVQIPYQEPSPTLFNLIRYLDEVFRRVTGTTSELVGESTKNVPVGTTLARIEQGLKVQTAIQIRCHQAQARELQLVSQLTAETLPDAAYCRDVLRCAPEQFAAEFDARVDVRPVSDPNAITATQRLITAQALWEMANQAPDLYNRREAAKRLLETMRVPEVDALLTPDQTQVEHMGPVEENMALTMQRPVKTFPDQDHQAHLIVHQTWLTGLDPETLKRVQAASIAHIAEHLAWAYYLQMQQAMQMPLPAAPMGMGQSIAPEQENWLAMMAAQVAQLMSQKQPPPSVDPAAAQAAAKAEAENAKAAAEIRRRDAIAEAQVARDDAQAIAKMRRGVAEHEAQLISRYMSQPSQRALEQPPT